MANVSTLRRSDSSILVTRRCSVSVPAKKPTLSRQFSVGALIKRTTILFFRDKVFLKSKSVSQTTNSDFNRTNTVQIPNDDRCVSDKRDKLRNDRSLIGSPRIITVNKASPTTGKCVVSDDVSNLNKEYGSCPNLSKKHPKQTNRDTTQLKRFRSSLQVPNLLESKSIMIPKKNADKPTLLVCSKSTPMLQNHDCMDGEIWEDHSIQAAREQRKSRPSLSLDLNSSTMEKQLYSGKHIAQLLDFLFIGSVESAYNEPLLCQLSIDALVDITNMVPEQIPADKRNDCPCMCKSTTKHLRSKLYVSVPETDTRNLEKDYKEINAYIEGIRKCGKRILVFSAHGTKRAQLVIFQYLMTHRKLLLRQAYNLVKSRWLKCDLTSEEWFVMELLERRLYAACIIPKDGLQREVKLAWSDR